jgi:hypothetical protein
MKYFKFGLFLALMFVIASCSTSKEFSQLTDDDIVVSMKRGACFGKCPIYTVSIYDGAYAVYEPRLHTKLAAGKYKKKLDKKQFKTLKKSFKKSDFFNFKDEYPSLIADLAEVRIFFKEGSKEKWVRGKEDRPAKLMELQFLVEKIVEEDNWELISLSDGEEEEEEETEIPEYIKTEIIIEPAPNTRLPLWLREMEEKYGIRLMRKLAPDQNFWLITYNTNKYSGEEILEILRNDRAVEKAEFNKLVRQRN